jgi:GT2 family glycosyltransferase
MRFSIVTPTFYRYKELPGYFKNIEEQHYLPFEVILVDGAPINEDRSEIIINKFKETSKLNIRYYRYGGGTAIQRNYGIEKAKGDIILFIDDDVRIDKKFINELHKIYTSDIDKKIGGITGYRTNSYFDIAKSPRWKFYRLFNFFNTYIPGSYDYKTGYPINNSGFPPFKGIREVDFMTTACTSYRSEIVKTIKFDTFFIGYGVLEDAHLALKVKKAGYKLLQCGDAKAIELSAPSGRSNHKIIAERTATNYYFVFKDICGPLSFKMKYRFIRFQLFELLRSFVDIFRFRTKNSVEYFIGKSIGVYKVIFTKI